jgi:trigger factor
LSKNQILKELEKFKVDEIPENLIDEEVKILSQGMSVKKMLRKVEKILKRWQKKELKLV